jgi:transcriptional regulator with XRE-family HTH domain
MHLGKKIRVARLMKELSQQELADKIGKTRPLISQIENTGKVKTATLKLICKELDIDLSDPEFNSFFEEREIYHTTRDIEAMERELETLRALVEAQREIIEHLKKQVKNTR